MPLSDWTVDISDIVPQSPTLDHVSVVLTNDKRVIADVITVTGGEDVAAKVRDKIASIEQADARRTALVVGPLDVSPPVVMPPDPPTQDQIDKAAYLTARAKAQTLQSAFDANVKLGLVKPDDAATLQAIADKIAIAKPLYKPEYGEVGV